MKNILLKSKWLLLREFYSLLIKTLGYFLLMKLIGPAQFGIYASVVGLAAFCSGMSQMGINIFVVKEKFNEENISQSITFILITTISTSVIFVFYMLFFSELKLLLFIVFPTIILCGIKSVSLGLLEKNIEYKKISLIDLFTQIIFYSTSFLLYKFGALALCIGYTVSVIYNAIHILTFHPISFKLNLPSKKMIFFCLSYSFSNFGWQSRNIINMILLPTFGAVNVGYFSFAIKLCESANIIKDTTKRVTIKILSSNKNVINIINRGILIQVFSICSLMTFIVFIFPLINKLIGKNWEGMSIVVTVTSIFYCVMSFFNIQSLFLIVLNKNLINGIYSFVQTFSIIFFSKLLFPLINENSYYISLIISSLSSFIIYIGLKNFEFKHKQAVFYIIFFVTIIICSKFIWWIPIFSLLLLLNKNTRDLIENTRLSFIRKEN